MERLKLQLIICIAFLYIFTGNICIQVQAAELELEPRTSSDSNPYYFKISYTWTSEGKAFESYDVSESGQIAITFTDRTIGIFDHDMNFQYQISFETSGTAGVLWLDDNLLFINVRSNTAVACDKAGSPDSFYTITNSDDYFSKFVQNRIRNKGNERYFCTNSSGGDNPLIHYGHYTILKRISEEGEEEILYEAAALLDGAFAAKLGIFAYLSLCLITPAFVVFCIYRHLVRRK